MQANWSLTSDKKTLEVFQSGVDPQKNILQTNTTNWYVV